MNLYLPDEIKKIVEMVKPQEQKNSKQEIIENKNELSQRISSSSWKQFKFVILHEI